MMTDRNTTQKGLKRALVEADPPKRNLAFRINDGKFRLEVTTGTDIGRRRVNEDRFRTGIAMGTMEDEPVKIYLFSVMDGHGGDSAVKFVRDNLFERIAKDLKVKKSKTMPELLRNAFVGIHDVMKERELENWPRHGENLSTSGTTAAVVALVGDKLWVAHVGDSRVIAGWKTGDKWDIERLTKDHHPSDAEEATSLIERGGVIRDDRVAREVVSSNGKVKHYGFLSMTRALGNYWSYCARTGEYAVSPVPDICSRTIENDCVIIMATDGITFALTDQEIFTKFLNLDLAKRQVAKIRNGKNLPEYFMADEIIEAAKDRCFMTNKDQDNMTAITLRITVLPEHS